MPRARKTVEEKQRLGTLRQSREKARQLAADPHRQLQYARELLEDMRVNATLASESIRKDGMIVELVRLDTHRKFITVQKTNPALKIQKEAVRAIRALQIEIADLEEQCRIVDAQTQEDADWEELGD